MERAEEYLRRAVDADEAADRATDPDQKTQWLYIAQQWRSMARQRQQFGSQPGDQSSED